MKYTPVTPWTFDQVYAFSRGNVILDNIADLVESWNTEHSVLDTGNTGDGTHGRISGEANLLLNPTAQMGNAGWTDGGALLDYDVPGTDTDQYNGGAANFTPVINNPTTDGGGPEWTITPATTFWADLSEKIEVGPGVDLTLSCELSWSVFSAGNAIIELVCYDSGGNFQGQIARTTVNADNGGFVKYEATAATLANGGTDVDGATATADTAYVRVLKRVSAASNGGAVRIRRVAVQTGTVARYYENGERSTQYVSARYYLTGDVVGIGTGTVVFDTKEFDTPGTDRLNPATGIFTADRYMKVRFSTAVSVDIGVVAFAAGDHLRLETNGAKGLARKTFDAAPANNSIFTLNGSDIIELYEGDVLYIQFDQSGASGLTIKEDSDSTPTYIAIEEI